MIMLQVRLLGALSLVRFQLRASNNYREQLVNENQIVIPDRLALLTKLFSRNDDVRWLYIYRAALGDHYGLWLKMSEDCQGASQSLRQK